MEIGTSFVVGFIAKRLFSDSYEALKKLLIDDATGSELKSTAQDLDRAITTHLTEVSNWSSEVSFKDLNGSRDLNSIYVDLDLYLMPRNRRTKGEKTKKASVVTIVNDADSHMIVLGHPGSGKTTSMKKLCQEMLTDTTNAFGSLSFPLVVRLREVNLRVRSAEEKERNASVPPILIDTIYDVLGLIIDFTPIGNDKKRIEKLKFDAVVSTLDSIGALLVFDGFDEIISVEDRARIVADVRKLCTCLEKSRLVLTSRTGDFEYHVDGTTQYELCALRKSQLANFARNWLVNEQKANEFIRDVEASPYSDTAMRPLTLSHLCVVFERTGSVPEKPKTLYKKVIGLLLEEWDSQRSVERMSQYAAFAPDRKFEFLSNLAYTLGTSSFSSDLMKDSYSQICVAHGLSVTDASQVVRELESHTGLILQSGVDQYEFAHKSLQEYLSAEYLVRLPTVPFSVDGLFERPNEIAIAIAISSRPAEYFIEVVLRRFPDKGPQASFTNAFGERLMLEKPDFNEHALLGIAILFHLSHSTQKTKAKYYEFCTNAVTQFAFSEFKKHYSRHSETENNILFQSSETSNAFGYKLPQTIIVKNSVLEKLESKYSGIAR